MSTRTAPSRLQSLLFGAVLACGLLFAGCSADSISGAASDEAAVQTEGKNAHDTTSRYGDHNSGCEVGDC